MKTSTMLAACAAAYAAGKQVAQAELLSTQAELAATQARLEATERKAITDKLTGLVTRDRIDAELLARAGGRESYAVALIDLDGFKAVNDTYRHSIGDRVLVEIAGRLADLMSDDDLVGRLGGDEFVVIAASPAPQTAALLGADLVRAIVAPVILPSGLRVQVGASVGVVHAYPGESPAAVLHTADICMFRAKVTGGGCLQHDPLQCLAGPQTTEPSARLREMADAGRDLAGVIA
jgi:diguanylate cyclase (GGDEF)-like protein